MKSSEPISIVTTSRSAANRPFDSDSFNSLRQPKLSINQPNDIYEQEADKVADQVMKMTSADVQTKPLSISPLQRKCDNCREEEDELQLKELSAGERTPGNEMEGYVGNLSSGGQPLPENVRSFYEPRFGYDFSNVKVHTNTLAAKSADNINALAYTSGSNIVFNKGQYDPGSNSGKRLLGHELTHVVQQGSSPNKPIGVHHDNSSIIRRGEAPVHRDIELTALGGVKDFTKDDKLTPEQKAAAQMYAGNWMRDYSQLNVPKPVSIIANLPKQVDIHGTPVVGSGKIGAGGAQEIIYGIIRALAALEFGKEITDSLITKKNIGAYRPQEHIDNPAGMTYSGDVLPDSISQNSTGQYKGAAISGDQIENPDLYKVSSAGLAEHIYNSVEFIKLQLIDAIKTGSTPDGRMKLGTGLHGVEDYFSHSNFIEVALNILLKDSSELKKLPKGLHSLPTPKAGGAVVDTLFDANAGKRQAVTTGTFGSIDTAVSIAEVILPKLPALLTHIDNSIDKAFGIINGQQDITLWDKIKKILATDKGGAAMVNLFEGLDASGMMLSSLLIKKKEFTIPGFGKYWIAYGYDLPFTPASQAILNIGQAIRDIKETSDTIKNIPKLLIPDPVLQLLDSIDKIIDSIKEQIKMRVRQIIFSIVQEITGIDAQKAVKMGSQALEDLAAKQIESLEKKSSLQSRFANREDDINKLSADEKSKVIPSGSYPPSHSEISKDHPAHTDAAGSSVKGANTKSIFFDIHHMLAVEADKQIIHLTEVAWAKNNPSASVLPSGPIGAEGLHVEALKHQASDISFSESLNAKAENRHFAQAENTTLDTSGKDVLNAVDLFINHPTASGWWKSIIESYAKDHTQELIDDIGNRNKTRDERYIKKEL